jgi:hypothetical protein
MKKLTPEEQFSETITAAIKKFEADTIAERRQRTAATHSIITNHGNHQWLFCPHGSRKAKQNKSK